ANADTLGVAHRLTLVTGEAPDALEPLKTPDAIFVGGGLTPALIDTLTALTARLVVNVVTLEGEAWVSAAQEAHGGDLMRIDIAEAKPLGRKRGWATSYPVVQWSLNR
ncbi:MAG: cobalamin biosynthesis bifunctional protein CbiET, partial [Pseudomonadota bacterium]